MQPRAPGFPQDESSLSPEISSNTCTVTGCSASHSDWEPYCFLLNQPGLNQPWVLNLPFSPFSSFVLFIFATDPMITSQIPGFLALLNKNTYCMNRETWNYLLLNTFQCPCHFKCARAHQRGLYGFHWKWLYYIILLLNFSICHAGSSTLSEKCDSTCNALQGAKMFRINTLTFHKPLVFIWNIYCISHLSPYVTINKNNTVTINKNNTIITTSTTTDPPFCNR